MTTHHHKRMLGNLLRPLNSIIKVGDNPLDLASLSVKFQMEDDAGTSVVADSTTGVTAHPTQVFTASATTDLLTCNGHGVKEYDQIVVATSGTLPTGLAASTRYFAVNVTQNAFSLATLPQGAAIDITGAGSGTHTFYVVGAVQKVFLAADVDTAGVYRAWFTAVSGSDGATAPVSRQGITVEILPFGN
jgi:hypothetical protein